MAERADLIPEDDSNAWTIHVPLSPPRSEEQSGYMSEEDYATLRKMMRQAASNDEPPDPKTFRQLQDAVRRQMADPEVTGITLEMLQLERLEQDALNPPPIWSEEYPTWHARQPHLRDITLPGSEPEWTRSARGLLPGTIFALLFAVAAVLLYGYVSEILGIIVGVLAVLNGIVAVNHWVRLR